MDMGGGGSALRDGAARRVRAREKSTPSARTEVGGGVEAPKGAAPVSFSAWSATRDEKVTLLEGMEPSTGGFGLKLEEVALTREPKQDTIGSSRVASGKAVASPRLNGA
jgi:hypothetical protein